jgi:hypothetical protein
VRKIKLLLFGVVLAALLAVPAAAMAKSHDRNHDRIPDKWEKHFGLSTKHNVAKGDPDKDGLNNLGEFRSKTNPRKADTNGNGVNDANDDTDNDGVDNQEEMQDHTNPADADTDNDGVNDGQETAGTIVSFTEDSANPGTGVLTIKLADNSTVSGKVDSTTELECRTAETPGSSPKHGADDNSGSGSDSSGSGSDGADDGPNHDAGDDNGGQQGDPQGGQQGDDNKRQCTTADLTANTPVHEAELKGSGDQAVFEKVELLK